MSAVANAFDCTNEAAPAQGVTARAIALLMAVAVALAVARAEPQASAQTEAAPVELTLAREST